MTDHRVVPIVFTVAGTSNSHEVLLMDPAVTTISSLYQMLMDVFVRSDVYRAGLNTYKQTPTARIKKFCVQLKNPSGEQLIRITQVHEANVEAVLRLLGQTNGNQTLTVEFEGWV